MQAALCKPESSRRTPLQEEFSLSSLLGSLKLPHRGNVIRGPVGRAKLGVGPHVGQAPCEGGGDSIEGQHLLLQGPSG